MRPISRVITILGGRRILGAFGGLYVVLAAGWPLLIPGAPPTAHLQVLAILLVGSGLVFLAASYWLPRTDIRSDSYPAITKWCFGSVAVMLCVIALLVVIAEIDNLIENTLLLTSLGSVAGLGMGSYDAMAKTRARNAEEQRKQAEAQRQRAEEQRYEAERYSRELERANRKLERYETIVGTIEDGIHVIDGDDRFTMVNEAYAEMVGYDREELLGEPTSLVAKNADALAAEIRRDLEANGPEPRTYEATLETASGEEIEAEATMALIPSEDDEASARVAVVRDVTERNERKQKLERQNQRLESFASMLAHELRNPVNIGQIYSQQLPEEDDSEAVAYVTEAFDRIEDMIDVMLVLARGRDAVGRGSTICLEDVAREAWEDVTAAEATLEVDLDLAIEADETYVRHVFRNLYDDAVEHGSTSNRTESGDAVEHGSPSNRPEADDAVEHGGEDVAVTVGDLPTGFYVADDGCGIPDEDRGAVFDAGYTTAGGEGGTGLGLAFVRELADVYEWTCSVSESESGGAQFEFTDVTPVQRVPE